MSRLNRQSVRQARGDGLNELMIALLLGIVVMGGVAQVFYSTSQSYRAQQALSRVQESGRFAIEILKPRLRPAGRTNFCTARDAGHRGGQCRRLLIGVWRPGDPTSCGRQRRTGERRPDHQIR